MSKIITGFSVSGFRSFAEEAIILDDFKKINIFIGQNNCGKSNFLRVLTTLMPIFIVDTKYNPKLTAEDKPKSKPDSPTVFGLYFTRSEVRQIINNYDSSINEATQNRILDTLFADEEIILIEKEIRGSGSEYTDELLQAFLLRNHLNDADLHLILRGINQSFGNPAAPNLKTFFQRVRIEEFKKTSIDFIPAIREVRFIDDGVSKGEWNARRYIYNGRPDHSGIEIFEDLNKLKNPDNDETAPKILKKIEGFLKTIVGCSTVEIETPYTKKRLFIKIDGKRLPLSSLGTGIEELLIIATKSTIFSKQIVCIEEPEIHLHPTLQKKLINYLYSETDNQYFITTHSPHLMDASPCSVYHVRLEDGVSCVDVAIADSEKFSICKDLGFKASDILQANCILWVEGPSDRIYLNHWLNVKDPELKEGIDYAIMFYGGRLLSHLNVDDEEVSDFINLTKLNRNVALLMDSDRSKSGERLNNTKLRIKREIDDFKGLCLVTWGREIENYVPKEILNSAVLECHPSAKKKRNFGQYDKVTIYNFNKPASGQRTFDKIKVARKVCENWTEFSRLLEKDINLLTKFIRAANQETLSAKSSDQA